jgi:hypothetical protein
LGTEWIIRHSGYESIYKDRRYWAWDGGDFGNGNAAEKAQQIADILIEHQEL